MMAYLASKAFTETPVLGPSADFRLSSALLPVRSLALGRRYNIILIFELPPRFGRRRKM